jgi:hypothetical protein
VSASCFPTCLEWRNLLAMLCTGMQQCCLQVLLKAIGRQQETYSIA